MNGDIPSIGAKIILTTSAIALPLKNTGDTLTTLAV
jgi:hypothetical protein